MPYLNEADPNYEWEVDNEGLIIYSECCADRFSEEQMKKLFFELAIHLGM